jgi:hypothetical protein
MEDLITSLEVISLAGLLSGILDLTATSTLVKTQGIPIERLLQTIASGALGPSALREGKKTAAIGVFFHFFIAFSAALIYIHNQSQDVGPTRLSILQRRCIRQRGSSGDEPHCRPELCRPKT